MHDLSTTVWRRSTHSQGGGNCVEIADLDERYRAIRDAKNPTGSVLIFAVGEWTAFIKGTRDGEFGAA